MKQILTVLLSALVLAVVMIAPARAAVPDTISFQGRLTDTVGVLLNGTYNITLRIYDAASGGSLLWTEAHSSVAVVNGIHNIYPRSSPSELISVQGKPQKAQKAQNTFENEVSSGWHQETAGIKSYFGRTSP